MGTAPSKDSEDIIYQNESPPPRAGSQMTPPVSSVDAEAGCDAMDGRQSLASKQYSQMSRVSMETSAGVEEMSRPRKMMMNRFIEGFEEYNVMISKNGFSNQNVTAMEGQIIKFHWNHSDVNNLDLLQVIHDGEKLRPVVGGYACKQRHSLSGRYEQQFNLEGAYKFAINGIRCTPLSVTITRRQDLQAEVTDDGFKPDVLYVETGHAVRWTWRLATIPHTVREVNFCGKHGGLLKDNKQSGSLHGSVTGSHRQLFKRSGIYYFETEAAELGKTHVCFVHVKQTTREFKVNVMDRTFDPMILLIEEGDRVWWTWDRGNCQKPHSVYQIEQPSLNHGMTESYQPIPDGFRWSTPSKQGLLSHVFHKPGVYHYSDQSFDAAAEYIGTVIVKPKQRDLYVDLTETGFNPDLLYAQTGDRLWFTWLSKNMPRSSKTFSVLEMDRCLNPAAKHAPIECNDQCQYMDDDAASALTRMGYSTVQFTTIGVYYYKLSDNPYTASSCSVIVNPGPKNHTVHVTDHGFEPKVLTVRPNDRIWWVWQESKKQHNIRQVTHYGVPLVEGFNSGAARDSPSAFMYQFSHPGVFYVTSTNLPKIFGAIAVATQPQVNEVFVNHTELTPDPIVVCTNDIVCWVFRGLRQHDVTAVDTVDKLLDANTHATSIPPRKCLSQAVTQPGVLHYCSRSFQKQRKETKKGGDIKEEMKLSSVIADNRDDNFVISIDTHGFHPSNVCILQGWGVSWSWASKDHDSHNIIHVNSAESQVPLSVIHGNKSFNSGKPVTGGQYKFTFDECGDYSVASQGAPGYSCTIHVLEQADRTMQPRISSQENGGTVDRYHRVELCVDDEDVVNVYYTTYGSLPSQSSPLTKLYQADDGLILREPGLRFIRAVAVSEGKLNSYVYTSRRFWVLSDGGNDPEEERKEQHTVQPDAQTDAWLWWECVPNIKGCITSAGMMEVFWDPPAAQCAPLILGYQVYINNISYCEMFPPSNRTLNIVGLCGGRSYDVHVQVYPVNPAYSLQRSNKLVMISEVSTPDGGPIISLEIGEEPDSLVVVWVAKLADQSDISSYQLFLNDQQCGQTLVPDTTSNRCKVVIDGCDTMKLYKVYVLAVPVDGSEGRLSNVLEVMLPFDAGAIKLPPLEERDLDPDMYKQFIEIREGTGYLPDMDTPFPAQSRPATAGYHGTDSQLDMYQPIQRFNQSEDPENNTDQSRMIPRVEVHPSSDPDLKQMNQNDSSYPARLKVSDIERDSGEDAREFEETVDKSVKSFYAASTVGRMVKRGHKSSRTIEQRDGRYGDDGIRIACKSMGLTDEDDTVEEDNEMTTDGGVTVRGLTMFSPASLGRAASHSRNEVSRKQADVTKGSGMTMFSPASLGRAASHSRNEMSRKQADLTKGSGMTMFSPASLGRAASHSRNEVSRKQADVTKGSGMTMFSPASLGRAASHSRNEMSRKQADLTKGSEISMFTAAKLGRMVPQRNVGDMNEGNDVRSSGYEGGVSGEIASDLCELNQEDRGMSMYGAVQFNKPGDIVTSSDGTSVSSKVGSSYNEAKGKVKFEALGKVAMWAKKELANRNVNVNEEEKVIGGLKTKVKPKMSTIGVGTRHNMSVFTAAACARFAKTPIVRERVDGGTQTPNAKTHAMRAVSQLYFKTRRRTLFSFYEVARRILDYVSLEMKLRRAVGTNDFSNKRKTDWTRVRNFFKATSSFKRNQTFEVRARLREDENRKLGSSMNLLKDVARMKTRKILSNSKSMFDLKRGHIQHPRESTTSPAAKKVTQNAFVPRPPKHTGNNPYQAYTGQAYYSRLFQGLVEGQGQEYSDCEDEESVRLNESGQEVMQPNVGIHGDSDESYSDSQEETDIFSDVSSAEEDGESGEGTVVVIDADRPNAAEGKTAVRKRQDYMEYRNDPASDSNGQIEVSIDDASVSDHVTVATPIATPVTTKRPPRGPKKRHKKRPSLALIEVEDSVELNVGEEILGDDRREVETMMIPAVQAAPPGEKLVRQDLEGQFIVCEGDGILPPPSIMVESRGTSDVKVQWRLPWQPDPKYRLVLYVLSVVGERFGAEVNSNISFEAKFESRSGETVYGVQHCWNISGKHMCTVSGLVPGVTYRVSVVANFTLSEGFQPSEIQTSSAVIYYTVMGPPDAPVLRVIDVAPYQVTLEWDLVKIHENIRIKGYQVYVDNKPLHELQARRVKQLVVDNIAPGKTLSISVQAITSHPGYDSLPSMPLKISCPPRPPAPLISQQPSYKKGCVLIAWSSPQSSQLNSMQEEITLYCIHVDDKFYGDIKANHSNNKTGYQFFLTDLVPGQSYDVSVKAVAGHKHLTNTPSTPIFCLSHSQMSNIVPVLAPAVPNSPRLRVEGMHSEGIDVMWQTPQQYGDAVISGFQMMRNDKLYGAIIPPDVSSLRIKDLTLGDKITLQLMALTDHPVGKVESTDKDSGIDGSSQPDEKDPQFNERYSACRPGSKLIIHYTGLVQPPSRVWCEKVTGHTALIVWRRDDHPKAHFVKGDNYQVTWWPGDQAECDINSDTTPDDHLLIHGLHPATTYTVVVEARKMQKYQDVDEDATVNDTTSTFILTAKSEHLVVRTASPPDPPRNLGVVATSCTGVKVAWDLPQEHGVEVTGLRIDCFPVDSLSHVDCTCQNLLPDTTCAQFENLRELTDYLITVTAVTDEYFDVLPEKHRLRKLRKLPRDIRALPDDTIWLPRATILAKTSGTTKPGGVTIVKSSATALSLAWTPAVCHGTNKLQATIVRWNDAKTASKEGEVTIANHIKLSPFDNSLTIDQLEAGVLYRVVVEAVVSVKTSLDPDASESGIDRYRRVAHVVADAVYARTRAPIEPPGVLVSSYTRDCVCLYWEKPRLLLITGKDADDQPKYVRRYLEGYKLVINGKCHMILKSSAQTCTLTKCKPGRVYGVSLVALTSTEETHRHRKKIQKSLTRKPSSTDEEFNDELDESPSEPIEITLPKLQPGYIASLSAEFKYSVDTSSQTFGDICVFWTTQGETSLVRQFSIVWYNEEDRVIQTKQIGPERRQCTLPACKHKEAYNIVVEPQFHSDTIAQTPQAIQIQVPGPPDAPEILLKSVEAEELVVEWGEPRLYGGVKVRGYQVYLNERTAGSELSVYHLKAVIPIRPNRRYKVNLVALSADPLYPDSLKSNTLVVGTGPDSGMLASSPTHHAPDDWTHTPDEHDIHVKVTGVTENTVTLDWSGHLDTDDIECYKVQWSSVAQPMEREVKLLPKDTTCVINKCLPGTTHFIRLVSVNAGGNIVDRSKRLTLQTSAPPAPPVLTVRACNFRYIAVQWSTPTTYGDALITGYKVYVNRVVEAVVGPDHTSYTFTHGRWCHEYTFQVQAITSIDKLSSVPSEPLVIVWPGVTAPDLVRLPTSNSRLLRVRWNEPLMTDSVRIKHFKLVCKDASTEEQVQTLGPLHPDTSQAEFRGLKKTAHTVTLEVHVYGTNEVVSSHPLYTHPALVPDAPELTVTVVGMEERLQLERVAADLCNLRDRLIRSVGSELKKIGVNYIGNNQHIVEAAQTLSNTEQLLETAFTALSHHTGSLVAHLRWVCLQQNPDIEVNGYTVLVDGKQYGSSLGEGVRNVRVKLTLDAPVHNLSVVAMATQPEMTSDESNVVEVLTDLFHPFSFYCYNSVHACGAQWPRHGCCKYNDSIKYERQQAKKLANQGLLKRQVPPPVCSLLDIFDGEYKPLLTHNKLSHPTAMLFWTPWCLASQRTMNHFVRFAREMSNEYNFIAVMCGQSVSSTPDRQNAIHQIVENGWRDDSAVWHCSSQCSTTITDAYAQIAKINDRSKTSRHNSRSGSRNHDNNQSDSSKDLTDLLGIAGVPTFLFIHQDGYISWHGRYCAFNYPEFAVFMRHTFCEVKVTPCTVYNCACCHSDFTINPDIVDILSRYDAAITTRHSPPLTADHAIPPADNHDAAQKHGRLSVNLLPFSGTSQPRSGRRSSPGKRKSTGRGFRRYKHSLY